MSVQYFEFLAKFNSFFMERIVELEAKKEAITLLRNLSDDRTAGRITQSQAGKAFVEILPLLEKAYKSCLDEFVAILRGEHREDDITDPPPSEHLALPIATPSPAGRIYFVAAPEASRIKIGFSNNPDKRIASLMTSSAYKLETLAIVEGSREQEQALHQRFAHLRVHREWFADCGEIRSYVANL